jgi:hypothetical protein
VWGSGSGAGASTGVSVCKDGGDGSVGGDDSEGGVSGTGDVCNNGSPNDGVRGVDNTGSTDP